MTIPICRNLDGSFRHLNQRVCSFCNWDLFIFFQMNSIFSILLTKIIYFFHVGLSKHWLAVKTQVILSIISISVSIWLLFLSVGVQNFCVICLTLFLINIVIVALALIRHERLRQTPASSSSSASSSGSGATQKKKAPAAKKGRSKKDWVSFAKKFTK